MQEIKRLTKILNIELAMAIIFAILMGLGIFWVFLEHTAQSDMMMGKIRNIEAMDQLEEMDRFINNILAELFLFFVVLSVIFVVASRKFTGSFIKKMITDLTNKTKELETAKSALEEGKAVLEVKVAARTKELQELNDNLEENISQRTKELQEKISELERFNKLAIGRELRMVELKGEIEKLKKQLARHGKKN